MGSSHLTFFSGAGIWSGSWDIGGVRSRSGRCGDADWLGNNEDFGDEVAIGFWGVRK